MQSVVIRQDPLTLERKIASGGKQKNEDNTHNTVRLRWVLYRYASVGLPIMHILVVTHLFP